MTVGTVKWFSNKKGYGFITLQEQESERDVFVHYSGILGEGYKTLNEGDQVEFELVDGEKGPAADQVKGV